MNPRWISHSLILPDRLHCFQIFAPGSSCWLAMTDTRAMTTVQALWLPANRAMRLT